NLDLSTIPLARHLAKLLGHPVSGTDFLFEPRVGEIIETMEPAGILVLGNLRFDPGEEQNDDEFARKLGGLAEVYVNDAFAVCHRNAASVSAITKYLPAYGGLLLESETATLSLLLERAESPFIVIVGGAKIKDKAGVINNLARRVDRILLGGAVANTFLAAGGTEIGQSLSDPEMVEVCRKMREEFGPKITVPLDGVRKEKEDGFDILDIGPETIKEYTRLIRGAKTIFWNGNLGYTEDERYAVGTKSIAEAITEVNGTKVVAGGDTVSFINSHNLSQGFTFISTGGGAALEFLSGRPLPGIIALEGGKD
ncbi:MAG: phosphoglycerate kinase, partial [Patescibacteria group bacterium]